MPGFAVVLVNQVTTKIGSNGGYLAPALGDSWAHACTSRVMLFWEAGSRFARLYKSPSRKCETVAYNIQAEGVRAAPCLYLRRCVGLSACVGSFSAASLCSHKLTTIPNQPRSSSQPFCIVAYFTFH